MIPNPGLPTHRLPTHPGEMLLKEFLEPLAVSQVAFARHLGIPLQRLNELIKGKRGVTPDTAWLLSMALETTPQIWLDLQANYDLARHRPAHRVGVLRGLARAHRMKRAGAKHPAARRRVHAR